MIYTAGTSALAVLEYVAHVPRSVPRPAQIVLLKIELPDASVEELTEAKIPADWDAIPAPMSTQTLGTEWAQSLRSVALVVPTVLLPRGGDANVLINPLHEGMARVRVTDRLALAKRMFGTAAKHDAGYPLGLVPMGSGDFTMRGRRTTVRLESWSARFSGKARTRAPT